MIGRTFACLTFLSLVATAAPALADDWPGLYVGVDARDGSLDYLSIVPTGGGTYDIRTRVPEHSMCSGPGLVLATGQVRNRQMVRENVVVRCQDTDTEIKVENTAYTLDDDIISLEAPDDGRMLYFHRISDD